MSGPPQNTFGGGTKRTFSAVAQTLPSQADEGPAASRWGVTKRGKKVSTDVYPDPEPDYRAPAAIDVSEQARAALAAARQAASEKVDQLLQPAQAPAEADAKKPSFFDDSLVHKAPPGAVLHGRKALLVLEAGPRARADKHTQQADKLRKLEAARNAFKTSGAAGGAPAKKPELLEWNPLAPAATPHRRTIRAFRMDVPDVEPWDKVFLATGSYADIPDTPPGGPPAAFAQWNVRPKQVTHLIEHPVVVAGPNTSTPLGPQPLKLTKKEQKKLRTATRVAREKKKQEMIALGLKEPPPPKVRLANMMKVLGKEAVQDPTIVERMVRKEAAERVGRHEARNAERKLDAEERRKKTVEKMKRDADDDPMTTVFRIRHLHSTQAIWKITENAKQFHLSGMLVTIDGGINMVVVEGGRKPMRKYARLLLHRIDYKIDDPLAPANVVTVWQGSSSQKRLPTFKSLTFSNEEKARKYLEGFEATLYLDLVLSGMEQNEDASADELL
ncbi:U4/U5/U6 small nuclear ribonucleoprotein prp3 [Diplonema papillatum]|nr:U4/U5/U6 small nuclear ribonucleoprotein prp3 [Diplonema papillatum]WGM49969.1 PRP3 [Diplonema papillatum]